MRDSEAMPTHEGCGPRSRPGAAIVVALAVVTVPMAIGGAAHAQPTPVPAPAPSAPAPGEAPGTSAVEAPGTSAVEAPGTSAVEAPGTSRSAPAVTGEAAPAAPPGAIPSQAGPPPSMLYPDQQPIMYFAQPLPSPTTTPRWQPHIDAHAELRNLFLFRNDADFDRTAPVYDANGQTVGAFATVFRPMLTFHASETVRMFYEAELGLNYWSKNNPDQEDPLAEDVFKLKHRQVYAEGEVLDGRVGFKVGYQLFEDPTGLFVGHWIGAASGWYSWSDAQRIGLFVGQVPDQTYEGINVRDDNFKRDITVFGPRLDFSLGKSASLAGAVVGLYDASLVDRTRWVVAPAVRVSGQSGNLSGFANAVVQVGKAERAALGGEDQNVFAWAAQLHGAIDGRPAALDVNLLVLSSDDAKDGNKNNGTFLYSSRNRSATIILTEDELRNWYDQLDRTMGTFRGGFWEHRAGLVVGDVKATWHATEVFRPAFVVGVGSVLQKNAALGHRFVGVESDLNLEFRASESLSANIVGGVLVPGKAAGALANRIDRDAAAPVYMLEANLLATY